VAGVLDSLSFLYFSVLYDTLLSQLDMFLTRHTVISRNMTALSVIQCTYMLVRGLQLLSSCAPRIGDLGPRPSARVVSNHNLIYAQTGSTCWR